MEELPFFVLALIFGGFLLFFVIMCCIRLFVYLTDDRKILCFKSKAALRRRRIQLSLLPEGGQAIIGGPITTSLGYVAAPDENINEHTICQNYVYEDGRSTGMRNLQLSHFSAIFGAFPPISINNTSISPNLSLNRESSSIVNYEEPPPPDYMDYIANSQSVSQNCTETGEEPPPPSYESACMKMQSSNHQTVTD